MPPPMTELILTLNSAYSARYSQFLVQYLQALLRNVVGLNVVDADLQVLESGFIQRHDLLRR